MQRAAAPGMIPGAGARRSQPVVATPQPKNLTRPGPAETILIIEDETIMREACVEVLTGQGYRVQTAENGTSGLEQVKERRPDLVLVDIRMPGIEGLEVLRLIDEIDPAIVKIVITGYATIEYAVASMKSGAYDFLPKPFTPEELRLIVSRGLERRRLVAEREALVAEKKKMTEFFISIVSHQLQSPLAAVKQFFEVILGDMAGPVSDETREIITKADRRIDDLISLIQDWLSFARFDPTKVREGFVRLDVAAVIGRHLDFLAPLAAERDVKTSLVVAKDPPLVMGDERSLGEVFGNLISNGVKYNRPGGNIEITVGQEGGACVIRFSDTGIGIPEKDIPLIFSEFFRVKSTDTKDIKGTGLGLAIVKRIVEAHDGTIEFETKYGRGTVFTVRLPAAGQQA
jgi:two-component system sensor histidine kinase/response regulator